MFSGSANLTPICTVSQSGYTLVIYPRPDPTWQPEPEAIARQDTCPFSISVAALAQGSNDKSANLRAISRLLHYRAQV